MTSSKWPQTWSFCEMDPMRPYLVFSMLISSDVAFKNRAVGEILFFRILWKKSKIEILTFSKTVCRKNCSRILRSQHSDSRSQGTLLTIYAIKKHIYSRTGLTLNQLKRPWTTSIFSTQAPLALVSFNSPCKICAINCKMSASRVWIL